jgi:hypothetical protein
MLTASLNLQTITRGFPHVNPRYQYCAEQLAAKIIPAQMAIASLEAFSKKQS